MFDQRNIEEGDGLDIEAIERGAGATAIQMLNSRE